MYDDEVSVYAYTYNDDDGDDGDGDGNGDVDADGDGDVEGEQGHLWFKKVKRKLPAQEVYIHTNNTTKHSFSAIPFIAHYPLCRGASSKCIDSFYSFYITIGIMIKFLFVFFIFPDICVLNGRFFIDFFSFFYI